MEVFKNESKLTKWRIEVVNERSEREFSIS